MANALCPIHMVWPAIKERVTAGSPLFHNLTANSSNRHLKATMTALGFDQGGRYSPRAFRRGATQQILDSGSTLATILKTGVWLSACYKNYLGLMAAEALNISTLLLDTMGSDSEDSDIDRPNRLRNGNGELRNECGRPHSPPGATFGNMNRAISTRPMAPLSEPVLL